MIAAGAILEWCARSPRRWLPSIGIQLRVSLLGPGDYTVWEGTKGRGVGVLGTPLRNDPRVGY